MCDLAVEREDICDGAADAEKFELRNRRGMLDKADATALALVSKLQKKKEKGRGGWV